MRGHHSPCRHAEGRDIDVHARARPKTIPASVVARVGVAGEVDVFDLIRPRDERDSRAGVLIHLCIARSYRLLLVLGKFRDVVGNDAVRPWKRLERLARRTLVHGIVLLLSVSRHDCTIPERRTLVILSLLLRLS